MNHLEVDAKRDKLVEIIHSGKSKMYLGKQYTEKSIREKEDDDLINALYDRYEAVLGGQMVKALGKNIIDIYSKCACLILGMDNPQILSDNLDEDPFLGSAMQGITCKLYNSFGSYLAPLSVSVITGRHFIENRKQDNGDNGDNGDNLDHGGNLDGSDVTEQTE